MEMILKLMNANAKVILILCRLFLFNEHFLSLQIESYTVIVVYVDSSGPTSP